MTEHNKLYVNVPTLINQARIRLGYATSKELYREKKPEIDYQTWINAEAGRRVPTPNVLVSMADVLQIDREEMLMAYCQDKFDDEKSQAALKSMARRKFFDANTLMDSLDHDRSRDYIFSAEQVQEMKKDSRLLLYLMYTYDSELKTTIFRLSEFFQVEQSEVKDVIKKLVALGLVEEIDGEVRKLHRHSTLIANDDVFPLRKELLLSTMELNIKRGSVISYTNVGISENSFKKFLSFIDVAFANLLKMDLDEPKENNPRFEIAIACNRLSNGRDDESRSKK
jgi:hypothetical protein